MNWVAWKKRLGIGGRTHTGKFVTPDFAVELQPGFVLAARLQPSKRQMYSFGMRELPAGVLEPSANKPNVTDGATLRRVVTEATQTTGHVGGKLGLLIPDVAARVALLQFESLPENRSDAESIVLWRMREFLPYPPEEARVTFQVLRKQSEVVEVLGVAVRSSVLADYESAMEGLNGGAATVLPASLALLPLLPEEAGGQLLLHLSPGALTTAVVAANDLRYWRTRPLEGASAANSNELAREAARVLATCQDNLRVQIANVWFCARPRIASEVAQALAQALGRDLRPLPHDMGVAGLPEAQRAKFDHYGIPFAGLLANAGS